MVAVTLDQAFVLDLDHAGVEDELRGAVISRYGRSTGPTCDGRWLENPTAWVQVSLPFASIVKKNREAVRYLPAGDEGHGFAKKANADFLFYAMIRYLETTPDQK